MLKKREYIFVAALLLAAVLLTGRLRLRLDDIVAPFRNNFQSMMYLPRGDALKVVAAGFDAPLADALFVKALVYIPQASEQAVKEAGMGEQSKMYIHELFDVITDLSPRFYRAYQVGSLYLTASASLDVNLQGAALLRKGVAHFDKLESEGEKPMVDPRWLFHSLLATTYEVNVQSRLRAAGDADGAADARIEAGKHFRLAAASPDAPEYIIAAARGFESVLKGQGDIEAARAAVLSVWMETYNQAKARGDEDLAEDLEERVAGARKELEAIVVTRRLQAQLSQAGERYLKAKGAPAADVEDLYKAGFIRVSPAEWPLDGPAEEKDVMLALPDGSFRSRILARWETNEHLDLLLDGVIQYRRFHTVAPPSLEALVEDGILAALPKPPLAGMGQKYEYADGGAPKTTLGDVMDAPVVSEPQPAPAE